MNDQLHIPFPLVPGDEPSVHSVQEVGWSPDCFMFTVGNQILVVKLIGGCYTDGAVRNSVPLELNIGNCNVSDLQGFIFS
jgi:hypothetical protein